MKREYNMEKYTATYRLTAESLELIRKAGQQLQQNQPGYLLNTVLDPKLDKERRNIAKQILSHLQVALSHEIDNTHRALTLALSQAARSALRRMSIYLLGGIKCVA
jgi:hypothetical protein